MCVCGGEGAGGAGYGDGHGWRVWGRDDPGCRACDQSSHGDPGGRASVNQSPPALRNTLSAGSCRGRCHGAGGRRRQPPTKARVLADPDNGLWLIAGVFGGSAGAGEGALSIWAASADPTLDSFKGKVYAVDDAAVNWSTAPNADPVVNDPQDRPPDVLGCLSQH